MLTEAPRQTERSFFAVVFPEMTESAKLVTDSIKPGIRTLRKSGTSLAEAVYGNITRVASTEVNFISKGSERLYRRRGGGGRRSKCFKCFGRHNSVEGGCKGGGILPVVNFSKQFNY